MPFIQIHSSLNPLKQNVRILDVVIPFIRKICKIQNSIHNTLTVANIHSVVNILGISSIKIHFISN